MSQKLDLSQHTRNPQLDIPLVFSGKSHEDLAKAISEHLHLQVSDLETTDFADGQRKLRPVPTVRKRSTYIIQTATHEPDGDHVNDHLIDLVNIIDALSRASASEICVITPFMFGCRQDRKSNSHEPITSALYANMIQVAGGTSLVAVRMHSAQQQGFFGIPVDNIDPMPLFIDWITQMGLNDGDLCMVAPDVGESKNVSKYAGNLGCDYAIINKDRHAPNKSTADGLLGEVDGKKCVITDDIVDTAGTVANASKELKKNGATEVYLMATHPLFSSNAIEKLQNAPIEKVVVTDTLPLPKEKRWEGLEVIPISKYLATRLAERHTADGVNNLMEH